MTHKNTLAVAILLAASAAPAMAIDQGDWLVRFGIGHAAPNDSSSDFSGALGVGAGVDADTKPVLSVTYMVTDRIGIDLLGAWPFEHDIRATGALGGKVGSAKHLPPTLGVQYHFAPKAKVRPYVGVGVNYTHFWDEKLTAAGQTVLGSVELEDSVGLAGQVGVDVDINAKWFVNADVRYINIETKGTTANVGIVKVDVDPWVFIVGLGTRF